MTNGTRTFEEYRLDAAREFGHTMIVVDDEASQRDPQAIDATVREVRRPTRRAARSAVDNADASERPNAGGDARHFLDAKILIDNAMELGLVCSVLRPRKGEDLNARVTAAAERADIVCLDWEIYNDDGKTAKALIKAIVRSDAERGGRLRLIAIYTGEPSWRRNLNDIFSVFTVEERQKRGMKRPWNSAEIVSNDGLRIVYLCKKHGTKRTGGAETYQVGEEELPARLQREFAALSASLLSNVALATIASVRRVAHHVVAKFGGNMDGPYFHHRTTIDLPDDAEDYAVEVIFSELKNAVDKFSVADRFAGADAIDARIRNIAGPAGKLPFSYVDRGATKQFEIGVADAINIVQSGFENGYGSMEGAKPRKTPMEEAITSIFGSDIVQARNDMLEFACLTGVRSDFGSQFPYHLENAAPTLGLGSVVKDDSGYYWLCLQASCDSVRLTRSTTFVFAPLCEERKKPEIVVPIEDDENSNAYLGLSVEKKAYTKMKSIEFMPNPNTKTVKAETIQRRSGFFFRNPKKGRRYENYRWIADLKHKRALRSAQHVGQEMGRLGFDEFEPFRRKDRE